MSRVVHQHEFQRVECEVLHQVSRAQSYYFDIVFHSDGAKQTISIFLRPGAQRKGVFSFSVNRDASNGVPRFPNYLNPDIVLFRRRTVLKFG